MWAVSTPTVTKFASRYSPKAVRFTRGVTKVNAYSQLGSLSRRKSPDLKGAGRQVLVSEEELI